jgi:hypothetical protein
MKRTRSFQIASSTRLSLSSLLAAVALSANLAFADNCAGGMEVVTGSESTPEVVSPSDAAFTPVAAKKVSTAHCDADKKRETSTRVRNTVAKPTAKAAPNKVMPMQVNPENIQADPQD